MGKGLKQTFLQRRCIDGHQHVRCLDLLVIRKMYPAYLTYMQTSSCEMPGWMKHKLESRFLGEISITSHMQMTPPLWQKAKNQSLLMKVKGQSENSSLKLNIQKTNIMASGPITSWQIDGKTMETVTDFIQGAPKSLKMVTAAL